MDRLTYYLFRFFLGLFRLIPFWALYLFSDVVFLIIFYLIGYRKKVVMSNLMNSFPEKSTGEIHKIALAFYRHLADILVESIKGYAIKGEELVDRYRFVNPGVLDEFTRQGRDILCVAGHYGNWEWGGVASTNQLKQKPVAFYKPLSNKRIDAYVQKSRVQGQAVLASITRTAETFLTCWREPVLYYMIADQSPSTARLAFWVTFLNQDTATLHGPEKYARLHNIPVVFGRVNKIKRGYYEITFEVLETNPAASPRGFITKRFMEMLESEIINQPAYYLWSHRRWKLKKQ